MRALVDGAVLLELPNAEALALAAALLAEPPEGFLDAVPGARTLLVLFEPERFDVSVLSKPLPAAARAPSRTVKLQAVYDGPDLQELGPDAARRHAALEHLVAFLGCEPVDELPAMSAQSSSLPHGEPVLRVLAPGPFTSVQGAPRYGLSSSGVPAGGAMDPAALADANALAGNDPLAPGLEFTIAGPELVALRPVRVAFMGTVHELREGVQVKVGMLREGARGYVAVEGGLAPELVTRPLRSGDDLIRADIAATGTCRISRDRKSVV